MISDNRFDNGRDTDDMLGPQTMGDQRQQVRHQSQRMGISSVIGYKLCKCQVRYVSLG